MVWQTAAALGQCHLACGPQHIPEDATFAEMGQNCRSSDVLAGEGGSGDCSAPSPNRCRFIANTSVGHPKVFRNGDPTDFPSTCFSTSPSQVKKLVLTSESSKARPIHPDGETVLKMNIWWSAWFFISAGGSHHKLKQQFGSYWLFFFPKAG